MRTIIEMRGVLESIEAFAGEVIKEVTFGSERAMKISFTEPKHGTRRKDGHIASAKGEAPAKDRGFLSNSIMAQMKTPTFGIVNIGAVYGWILDQLRDREFVMPAIDKAIKGL